MRPSALILTTALLAGCGKGSPTPSGAASASASASGVENTYGAPVAGPFPPEKVVAAVNPEHKPPYAGPMGTLKGTVRIDGDPPPDSGLKFPDRCKDSEAAYGKIFRKGLDNALADVLVTVTDYGDRGWVPATEEAVKVALHRCAPARLTYSVTYGSASRPRTSTRPPRTCPTSTAPRPAR